MHPEAEKVVNQLHELREGGADKEAIDKVWGDFRRIHPQATDFSGANLSHLDLSGFDLARLDLKGTRFFHCKLDGAVFHASDLSMADFLCDLADINLTDCVCLGTRFRTGNLDRANFTEADLRGALFDGCTLRGTVFASAVTAGVKFDGVVFNAATRFEHLLDAKGMTMSKYEFASLGPEVGQLTVGNQMDMDIVDDAAKLRQEFGGVWAVLHLLGLFVFMGPYAWFLMYHWSLAQFSDDASGMTLGAALVRFILAGGDNWQATGDDFTVNGVSLACFVTYLVYNFFRACLVWKTKRLETEQEVKGLPVKFSLERERKWNACYWFVRATLYFAIAAVAINSIIFLLVRLPPVAP